MVDIKGRQGLCMCVGKRERDIGKERDGKAWLYT